MADVATITADLPERDFNILKEHAEQFLLSGLSWERWSSLGDESRRAFVEAGKVIRKEQARMIGEAVSLALENGLEK